MSTTDGVVSAITTATTSLQGDLLAVGAIGLGIGAVIFGLRYGWKFVKRLI